MLLAMTSCVSTSKAEPRAMSRKWAKSESVGLADPSAILELIEITALCNWSLSPFFSNHGIFDVAS